MTTTMPEPSSQNLFADPVAQKLLYAATPARFAYTGLDGAPRVIPIGWEWDGSALLDVDRAPVGEGARPAARPPRGGDDRHQRLPAEGPAGPGTATVRRSRASLEGYLEAGHKNVGDDQYDEWVAGVRSLDDLMVEIRITPDVGQDPRLRDPDPERRRRAGPEKQAAG